MFKVFNLTKGSAPPSWFAIKAVADDVVEIYIYDIIGQDWLGQGVSAAQFVRDLQDITASTIRLCINSPGGLVWEGVAIYNALRRHPARVEVHVDGLAASIASLIAMAGDTITMAANAMMMIHNPWACCCGDARDMREYADFLDKIRGQLAETYAARSGKPVSDIVAMLDAETWLTAAEAVELGLADAATDMSAAATADISIFNNPPSAARQDAVTTAIAAAPDQGGGPDLTRMRMRLALMTRGIPARQSRPTTTA
ncbi:MAG: head maturation protease, ClpP-related [Desulfovibrionaceae bacterium]